MRISLPHHVPSSRLADAHALLEGTNAIKQKPTEDGAQMRTRLALCHVIGTRRKLATMKLGSSLRVHLRTSAARAPRGNADVKTWTDVVGVRASLAHFIAIGKLRRRATMRIGLPLLVPSFQTAVRAPLAKQSAE